STDPKIDSGTSPLPRLEGASGLGAAHRNRTDEPKHYEKHGIPLQARYLHRQQHLRPWMLPAHSVLQVPGPRPGPRRANPDTLACLPTVNGGAVGARPCLFSREVPRSKRFRDQSCYPDWLYVSVISM